MKKSVKLIPFMLISFLLVFISWYVQEGMSVLFKTYLFKPIYIIACLAIIIALITALIRIPKNGMDRFFKIAVHVFFAVFVAQIIFFIINLIGDITRLGLAIFGNHHQNGDFLPPKIFGFSVIAFISFSIILILFIHGIFKGKYAYKVIKQKLFFENLPKEFDGFRIIQISDIHAGSFDNAKAVQRGINLVNKQKAD
ncbi:hypothetical protein [Pedobacter alpinus]|uniref:Metallophosphoesterase n=1 Tax=Pedobacter alpinus TaxID=1590643 RepID=A0ABW5TML8_9SPHI